MDRGLYIAASGMIASQVRQDQIANDLANVSTTGYKADRSAQRSFGDLLLAERSTARPIGRVGLGAEISEIRTDFTPAPLKQTDESLDVGIDGTGFLAVETQQGTRFTRNGQLALAADGTLVSANGFPVLGADGKHLVVGGKGTLEIAADGTITAGGQTLGRLGLVTLTAAAKQGETLFTGTPGVAPAAAAIRQGFLETSGVNAARTMIEMVTSLRTFESAQRVIRTIDDTLGRGIQAASTGA